MGCHLRLVLLASQRNESTWGDWGREYAQRILDSHSSCLFTRELAQDPEFKAMQQQAADSEKHAPTTTAATTEDVPVTTEEASKEPVEQVKPGSNFKFTPIKFDTPTDAEKTSAAAAKAKSEAEKRMERAKRFGVPVKEEVKKDLRAQKFGEANKKSPTTTPAAPASKPSQVSDTQLILCSAEEILI